MLQKLRELLLYMGLKREAHQQIREDIYATDRRSVIIYSVIGSIVFLVLSVLGLLKLGNLDHNLPLYSTLFVVMAGILFLEKRYGERHPAITIAAVYLYMAALLVMGIYLAVIVSPGERAASYLGFVMGLSALFLVPPIAYAAVVAAGCVALFILLPGVQSGELLLDNRENLVIFSTVSIVIGTYLMNVKASKLYSDRLNAFLLEKDQMTGVFNRRSYELSLDELRHGRDDTVIIAFDINGLKTVNDNVGHKAGDELICGAASCIQKVFGPCGRCFRTGGDEFMAILHGQSQDIDDLCARFDKTVSAWKGALVPRLTISYGGARAADHPQVSTDELVNLADKRMLTSKSEYYRRTGIDRRRT